MKDRKQMCATCPHTRKAMRHWQPQHRRSCHLTTTYGPHTCHSDKTGNEMCKGSQDYYEQNKSADIGV